MEGDWLIHESFRSTGANWSPVLFWQGQRVKKNPSVKSKSRWTLGMNLSLLLAVMGLCCRWFFETLGLFSTSSSVKKPCTWRNVLLEIPRNRDFSRFLGQVLDWLGAVNRAKTCLEVLLHMSPEKKGKLTGVLHTDMFTQKTGDLFSLLVTLQLQGKRDRSAGSKTLGTRRAGRSSMRREAAWRHRRLGPHFLAKG